MMAVNVFMALLMVSSDGLFLMNNASGLLTLLDGIPLTVSGLLTLLHGLLLVIINIINA